VCDMLRCCSEQTSLLLSVEAPTLSMQITLVCNVMCFNNSHHHHTKQNWIGFSHTVEATRKVAIAMHCNLRPSNIMPVILGFNDESHNAATYKIYKLQNSAAIVYQLIKFHQSRAMHNSSNIWQILAQLANDGLILLTIELAVQCASISHQSIFSSRSLT